MHLSLYLSHTSVSACTIFINGTAILNDEQNVGHCSMHYTDHFAQQYIIKLQYTDWWTMHSGGDPPCRLDYIWVSGTPDTARLAMQQAQHGCSYSDHLGVEAVCTFHDDHTDRCLIVWRALPAWQLTHTKSLHVQLCFFLVCFS